MRQAAGKGDVFPRRRAGVLIASKHGSNRSGAPTGVAARGEDVERVLRLLAVAKGAEGAEAAHED